MPFFVLDKVCKVRTGAYEGGTACVRVCVCATGKRVSVTLASRNRVVHETLALMMLLSKCVYV